MLIYGKGLWLVMSVSDSCPSRDGETEKGARMSEGFREDERVSGSCGFLLHGLHHEFEKLIQRLTRWSPGGLRMIDRPREREKNRKNKCPGG